MQGSTLSVQHKGMGRQHSAALILPPLRRQADNLRHLPHAQAGSQVGTGLPGHQRSADQQGPAQKEGELLVFGVVSDERRRTCELRLKQTYERRQAA